MSSPLLSSGKTTTTAKKMGLFTSQQRHLVLFLVACLLFPQYIMASEGRSPPTPMARHQASLQRRLTRTLQSWAIHHKAIPKTRSLNNFATKESSGSIFSFRKPTKERIAGWFGAEENDSDQLIRCMLRKEFNHESVGMTNPLLHVERGPTNDDLLLKVEQCSSGKTIQPVVSTKQSGGSEWWPGLSFNPLEKKKWRILRYRRRVGTGKECYERVRDAVLDWEFCTNDQLMGLIEVPIASEVRPTVMDPPHLPHPHVAPRGRHIVTPILDSQQSTSNTMPSRRTSIGASRRLVSFSAKSIFPGLPKLFAVNPVMVVYDVVDQRGPSTTFSSTAYATMKGHMIRGEERVTVALRDGDEAVEVEIISMSQPAPTIKARGIWPFVGKMQSTFFEKQMDHLERIGGEKEIIMAHPFLNHGNKKRQLGSKPLLNPLLGDF